MVMKHPIPIPARRPSQSAYIVAMSTPLVSLLGSYRTYQRTTDEETTDDSTDSVASVDQTDSVTVVLEVEIEPVEPVVRRLKSLRNSKLVMMYQTINFDALGHTLKTLESK